jgi:O-antigen/teichoic acid export membrane protein
MSTLDSPSNCATSALLVEEPPVTDVHEMTDMSQVRPQTKKNSKVLLSNIVWMLVGNVAYGFSQWTMLVVLAKLGTVEMVGNFALALAIVLPVLMFSSLSLRSLQITDALRSYRFLEYGAVRMITLALSLAFIVLFALASHHSRAILLTTVLIGGAKAFEYVSDILYGILQQEEDMSGIAISMLLRAALSILTMSAIVYRTHSLVWASAGLLLCSAAVLFGYDIPKAIADRRAHLRTEFQNLIQYLRELVDVANQKRLWKLALTGLPMGFALMMVSLNLNIPRYFIERRLGMEELGIFSALSTLLLSGSVAINAIGQAAAPRMASAFATGDSRKFSLLLGALIAASLGLGGLGLVGALLFGKQAMTLIYRPEYSTHQDVLVWLMAASGLYYLGSTLGYAVTSVRCFSPQMPLFIAAAGATALGCMVLIPYMGLRGAAVAILISAFVQCLGSLALLFASCRRSAAMGVSVLNVERASLSN